MLSLEINQLKQLALPLPLAQLLAELRYQQALTYGFKDVSTDLLSGMAIKSEQAAIVAINKEKSSPFNYQAGLALQANTSSLSTGSICSIHQALNSRGGRWRAVKPISTQYPSQTKIADIDEAMNQLVRYYAIAQEASIEPLVIVPLLLRDFFTIFPFIDGNRRVALLLARQLLIQAGHPVVQYIDIESEVAATDKAFYRSLLHATQQPANLQGWLMYWWVLMGRVYQRFSKQLSLSAITAGRGSKTALIEHFVTQQQSRFFFQDVCQAFPTISKDMVRVVLRQLRDSNKIHATGFGRGAFWEKI
jgi:hypothetical protein